MELKDLNIFDVGARIGLVGGVFSHEDDPDKVYLCMFPDQPHPNTIAPLVMDLPDWDKFIRQLDLQEVEVLERSPDGKPTKVILRKTQRIIEQRISWSVYARDNFTCRYCGKTGVPLTVDHLVLWEEGGPSTPENLVTSCRKCNRTRGNMQYAAWLRSDYYRLKSRGLTEKVALQNAELADNLTEERRHSPRGRR